jgi:hypothetical protein
LTAVLLSLCRHLEVFKTIFLCDLHLWGFLLAEHTGAVSLLFNQLLALFKEVSFVGERVFEHEPGIKIVERERRGQSHELKLFFKFKFGVFP